MTRLAVAMVAALFFFCPVVTCAQERPIPEAEWTEEAKHNLARCLVGEAGWNTDYHDALAWALSRSWAKRVRAGRELTFARQIALYCSALRVQAPTARQRWIRDLPNGPLTAENRSPHFSEQVSWTNYATAWTNVLEWTDRWAAGGVADACPGADNWGGAQVDSIPVGAVEVCRRGRPPRENIFFYVDPAVQRRRAYCYAMYRRYESAPAIPVEVMTCMIRFRREREVELVD